ncbi:hypothetical protein [Arthrobacter sp. Z1-15]
MNRIKAWIRRNLIDTDPNPEYSRLDRLDGLQPTPYGGMEDRAGFAALAKEYTR